ncbi:DUF6702 family protein [Flavobacterium sp. SUN046]|uniref:DUF6702 family protein n=1 Tax=Flavobacterium sp. SUN046 TaxID=3002440 RepID=UPI002DB9E8A9|nr:DUF6702 family protein [Flavobacterium sp. SUN046]MEC4050401.1 DUF6702 family protein [Flavobacterium sp. SUN046]
MKSIGKCFLILFVAIGLLSFGMHKFYTAIYQIEFVPKKKMIQITTRIFYDDLNEALEAKYHKRTFVGTEKETPEDLVVLKKYLAEKFIIKVNGQSKSMNFISKEVEDNVLICYLSIKEIAKIKTLEVENTIIMEKHSEQQNIIQANFNGEKQSLLLTSDNFKGMLK